MLAFHASHYYAERMRLVVVSNSPVEVSKPCPPARPAPRRAAQPSPPPRDGADITWTATV